MHNIGQRPKTFGTLAGDTQENGLLPADLQHEGRSLLATARLDGRTTASFQWEGGRPMMAMLVHFRAGLSAANVC